MEHIFYIVLLILSLTFITESICYFPDETIPRQDTPCQSEGESTCCGAGYACLSNNLCELTEHVPNPAEGQSQWVRGSCTDRTWKSPNCPNFCLTPSNGDYVGGGMGVDKCEVTQDRYYCINNQTLPLNTTDICTSSTYFFQFAGTPTTVTVIGVPNTSSTSATTTSTETTSLAISTSSSSVLTTPTSTAILSAEPQSKGKDYSVPISAGVGVPLGVIALALIGFLVFRHRRSAKQSPDNVHNSTVGLPQSHVAHKVHHSPQNFPQAAYQDQPEWVPFHEMPASNNQH